MDRFDEKIIQLLRENARQSVSSIADKVNLSRSAVTDRIRKLEETGIIRGYQVLLSSGAQDDVIVYLEISYNNTQCAEIASQLRRIPEIKVCHGVAGDTDMMLTVKAKSMDRVTKIRETISSIKGVGYIKTHVVLMEFINE
ncbi:AsnC family transcriptional regulator [Hahella sp. CCB-MM4]|uniref:Lrp/AsnC family transcriptional regulator n=1 Tax=Hahella sp. (strain CCB-MM4) TaxID=1926491 RepID=UPI000B9A1E18|nr:Lrp/AsnC family transcriptional regulator [Hahella sp. CCB-MM4]OZG73128.1 AsnC family transcriptional regulator [Hahella sp. CCB-MM4]